MDRMKIGLYFGSFNPIHIGHLIIAEYIANNTDISQVWFVVSPQNPFKKPSSLLNEYDRLHLVNLSIEENDKFRAVDVEFRLPKPSYTITTLAYLQEKYPDHEFSVIVGSDSFLNLPKWYNYENLIMHTDFIIYRRPGFEIVKNKIDKEVKYEILEEAPMIFISATYIRDCIKQKKSFRYLLREAAYNEIIRNRYYF